MGEQSAASSRSPACEKRRMWVLMMSVLTPGQLGATFRCISLWAVCRAHVTRVDFKATRLKVCLSMFCPYGGMEISMQTAAGCVRLIKYPPPQPHSTRKHTHTPHFSTVYDPLKGEKLFCWHTAKHNGGQRLYMHSLYVHQSAAPVGGS